MVYTATDKGRYVTELKQLQKRILKVAEEHKFEIVRSFDQRKLLLVKLMFLVTEISEAAEAVRKNDFDNFKEEIADAFIYILSLCESLKIDIMKEATQKTDINDEREPLHGKVI